MGLFIFPSDYISISNDFVEVNFEISAKKYSFWCKKESQSLILDLVEKLNNNFLQISEKQKNLKLSQDNLLIIVVLETINDFIDKNNEKNLSFESFVQILELIKQKL